MFIIDNINRKTNIFYASQGCIWIYCKSYSIWTSWHNGFFFFFISLHISEEARKHNRWDTLSHISVTIIKELGMDDDLSREHKKKVFWTMILITALPNTESKSYNPLGNNIQYHVTQMQHLIHGDTHGSKSRYRAWYQPAPKTDTVKVSVTVRGPSQSLQREVSF